MIHPAHCIQPPNCDCDFISFSNEVWFAQGVYAYKRSNNEMEYCPLTTCPITGTPMYMPHSYPLTWVLIKDKEILEAHMRFLVEKELLGAFDFNENRKESL